MASYTQAKANAATNDRDRPAQSRTRDAASADTLDRTRPDPSRSGLTAPQVGANDRDRPAPARSGLTAAQVGATDRARPQPARGVDATPSTVDSGIIIPGDFRRVDVAIVDPDGEPLTEVDWVMSAGTFPTAARVNDDGLATLWLLPVEYDQFMGVAERDGGNVDYTWYSASEEQEVITPVTDDTGEIVLNPGELTGMFAGPGVDFGGQLG